MIWFTPTAEHLSADKSVYVYGSRGSGKTTLLRSICWEDLLSNPSLRIQKNVSDFNYIGIYIRLPDHVSGSMGFLKWREVFPESPNPDYEFFRFYSLAIEFIAAEKALSALHSLRLQDAINVSAGDELGIVADICEEFMDIGNFSERTPRTFLDLSRSLRNAVRKMNEASGRGYLKDILDAIPTREPYEFLSVIMDKLSAKVFHKNRSSSERLGFKFCLDDCEVMSQLQRKSVNTLVRKSRFPISWVICSVGEAVEAGETFIDQQPLTDADRRVISLDDRDNSEFEALCQAVASLRVYFSLSEGQRKPITGAGINEYFSLKARLGNVVVNDIIHAMVVKSTNPVARYIRDAAKILDQLNLEGHGFNRSESGSLPYYQAYILSHWTGQKENFAVDAYPDQFYRIIKNAKQLKSDSQQAWMRRKNVGVLLQIANRLGTKKIPLSGSNIITTLADGSIRDFLEIMAEIFDRFSKERSKMPPEKVIEIFGKSRAKISTKIQTEGIYASSDAFYDGIGILTDSNAEAVLRFVDAIGYLTHQLQANYHDSSSLATAERGIFFVEPSVSHHRNPGQRDRINQVIQRAELAGYLRISSVKRGSVGSRDTGFENGLNGYGFRLHRRFSPHFMFSYRGAYEPVRLSEDALYQVCSGISDLKPEEWAKNFNIKIGARVSAQLTLPLRSEAIRSDE
ncbi:hypothetical protein [Brucella pseudogrignonensis]|uniref:ORC-CDC6 family AAA ATPase n=1 Tax=Brucella pseudogrignonensis TaxID=419475 RepID=UPI00124C27D3|nr:hypothetical protein [Brucella pseudogrignonensis]KAB2686786.1 hypothetical protein F9K82_18445 [Brucella pseudogrignonensis]